VGLAGTLAGDDPLIGDFCGRVLTAHRRPVDLRDGIVLTDRELAKTALDDYGLKIPDDDEGFVCVYRAHNTGLIETETLPLAGVGEGESRDLLNLALGLAEAGESTLAFFPSRREAEWAAQRLAEAGSLGDFRDPIEAGFEVEDESLLLCLEQGVGFHHADCSPRERQTVEEAFRAGRIKLLCCTSTLAMGVNLPAHNVVIHPFVWNKNGASGELSLLAESVLRNMAGRAGRLGLEEGFGRALLLASSRREWDLYRTKYWAGMAARLDPRLAATLLGPYVLSAVAAGHDSDAKLETFFGATLSSLRYPETRDALHREVRLERENAAGLKLLHPISPLSEGETKWELSPLGTVVATRGVSFATAKAFSDWIEKAPNENPSALACLLRICDTEEASEWNWPRDGKPETRAYWVDRVRERLGWEELASFGETLAGREAVSPRMEDAAKMAWGLHEWICGEPMTSIQDNLMGVSSGSLHAAGEGARWLLETLADVCRVKGLSQESADRIRTLACSAGAGLPEWALAWRIVPSELLDRDEKLRLAEELSDPFELLTRSEDEVPEFSSAHTLARIREFLTKARTKERNKEERSKQTATKKDKSSFLLDVDLVENGGNYRATADRHPIELGMRSAELLLRLVRGRKTNGPAGWVHKKDLGVDPESLSQRMSDLRRRLGHPPAGIKNWIESDRNGHYRLVCEGTRIRWDPQRTPPEILALME
jgi:replicative superfamily II helicase